SATTGWAVGDTGSISRTLDGGATWTEQSSGVTNHLYSVWGVDANNVWAVGQGGAILFWNGLTWSKQPTGIINNLLSVRGTSVTAVWAVGASGTLLSWNGTVWAAQSPPPSTANVTFNGVWAADATNIWAVGANGKIIKNDGTNWSSQTSGTSQQLNSVWGTSSTNIYAVGVPTTGGGATGTFLHWNGTAWAAMTNNVPSTGTYTSICGSDATHIWAVGTTGNNGVIRFYNGAAGNWTVQTSGTTQALAGVSAISSTEVVAVGARKVYDVYNGSAWTPQQSATPATAFNGSWGTDDNKIWFVGQGGIIFRWNGTGSWTNTASTTVNNLNAVWGSDEDNVWAVGAGGTIVKWNGTTWAAQASGTTAALTAIYGTSFFNIWAVGANGVIVKWNGTAWAVQASTVTVALTGVWASDANNAWAVGNMGATGTGTILKCTANVWKAQSTSAAVNLTRVWGASATAIWAVGENGIILKSAGTTWAVQGAGATSVRLASIHGVNATNQWAVGGGSILRGNGSTWSADGNTPLAVPLTGVFATGVSSVFLLASNGMIFLNSPATVPELTVEQPTATVLFSILAGVDFGTVPGPLSGTKTFTLRNTGTADLTGLSVTVDGTNATDFQAAAPLATTLAPGASTTFVASFSPTKEGPRVAALHVKSNDLDHPSFNVTLIGTGVMPPKVTVKPVSKTVNPTVGAAISSVTFTIVATGTVSLSYQWRKGGTDIPGETGTSYKIPSVVESDEATYDVKITNPATVLSGIPTLSDPFTLTVNDPVVVQTAPVAQSVSAGSAVSLSVVVASGTGPITYQWRKNFINILGATSATYTIPSVLVSQGGNYSVAIKNPVGTTVSPIPDVALNVADT
ncbi:MAG: hypothetical protein JWO08_4755, partial [Verrucomicrobiaceae bacterium]|nr:hypothetical protein [Verrucomicrobiaceae bacterium]